MSADPLQNKIQTSKIKIDFIFGSRSCGNTYKDVVCAHVRSNIIKSSLPMKEANKTELLLPIGSKHEVQQPNVIYPPNGFNNTILVFYFYYGRP